MALNDDQLFTSTAGKGAEIRMFPTKTKVGTVDGISGAPLLPRGTPVAFDTSAGYWTVFTQGGSNGTAAIRGFIADSGGVQTHASNEVQAIIMLEGEIHRDDVNTAAIRTVLGGSASEANVDTALKASLVRELGLHVRGLAAVN